MSLSGKPLDSLDETDLRSLLENAVSESARLDFKRDAVGNDDSAKREFLKDVSALANTYGGDLLFGVREDDGVACELTPIIDRSADSEIARLETIITDGLEPRLTGCRIGRVQATDGGFFLIVRVPVSWNRPHRVSRAGHNKFYRRRDRSVYEMDVSELRTAFGEGGELQRRLQAFREARVAAIRNGRPVGLVPTGRLLLHILPLSSTGAVVDVRRAWSDPGAFDPPGLLGRHRRYNFDGLVLTDSSSPDDRNRLAFVQLFRDGPLEVARGGLVSDDPRRAGLRWLLTGLVREVVTELPRYLGGLMALGVPAPFLMLLTLLDVEGTWIGEDRWPHGPDGTACAQEDLLLPPALIENPASALDVLRALCEPLDVLWNAFGYASSPFFTDTGEWRPTSG